MNIWHRRLFLVVSIGGGFTGFAVTSGQLFQPGQLPLYYMLCVGVAIAYASGVYGGLKLVEEEAKGLAILSWYFLAQIPIFVSPIISYQFSSGLTAYTTVGTIGLSWGANFGCHWQFSLFQFGDRTLAVGANLFAIWATWFLRKQLARKAAQPGAGTYAPYSVSAKNESSQ